MSFTATDKIAALTVKYKLNTTLSFKGEDYSTYNLEGDGEVRYYKQGYKQIDIFDYRLTKSKEASYDTFLLLGYKLLYINQHVLKSKIYTYVGHILKAAGATNELCATFYNMDSSKLNFDIDKMSVVKKWEWIGISTSYDANEKRGVTQAIYSDMIASKHMDILATSTEKLEDWDDHTKLTKGRLSTHTGLSRTTLDKRLEENPDIENYISRKNTSRVFTTEKAGLYFKTYEILVANGKPSKDALDDLNIVNKNKRALFVKLLG